MLCAFAALSVWSCSTTTSSTGGGDPAAQKTCQSDPECGSGGQFCDTAKGACAALPPGSEIGHHDGSAASVTLTEIFATASTTKPVDLAFNPDDPTQLWVIGYGDDSVYVGTGAGTDAVAWKRYVDPAAEHFMHRPPAMAMGASGTWATCGDNDNTQNSPSGDGAGADFMGPALFSTNTSVFAKPATMLGSHLDMLHNTPLCRGIAHVAANWYWVFNANDKSLDKYNFAKDHGPGNDDHADGEIYRYAQGQVKGADGFSSHLFYEAESAMLYVADTGNARIVRLDTTKGKKGKPLPRQYEPLKDDAIMAETSVEVVVAPGAVDKPSGLELKGELIYVTDAATSQFHVFDKTGKLLRSLDTALPPGSLSGFTFGPDRKIWFTDRVGGRVLRIDPL